MRRGSRILPFAEWPIADQTLWEAAIRRGDIFEEPGPLSHLSPHTHGLVQHGYGKWLSWLGKAEPDALAEPPAARLTAQRFIRFAEALSELSPKTRHTYAANALRLMARTHPSHDWQPHWNVVLHLKREADTHVSRRKEGRIFSGNYVLSKGLELEGPTAAAAPDPRSRQLLQRNGTLIAFLSLIPIRRRALVSLRLGSSVIEEDGGIFIRIAPEMSKTKTFWETRVPEQIRPALERYLQQTRPALTARLPADHGYLWVTKDGDPLTGTAMATLIRNQTRELFGKAIGPHLFRDIAATTLARISPGAVGHVRPLLGHRGDRTAEKHYNHATSLEVGRNHSRLIAGLAKGD